MMSERPAPDILDRTVSFADGLPSLPERLLLAHARGEVVFIAGAGVSQSAGLPNFRGLVLDVYRQLDPAVYDVMSTAASRDEERFSSLTNQQAAEVRRFWAKDFDVVLGMLERRMDSQPGHSSSVRLAISELLGSERAEPALIHRALMRLSDRGGVSTIVTTNFDRLLEEAVPRRKRTTIPSYALGAIPRPGRRSEFAGVLHIHGALNRDVAFPSDLIVSDHDFGEFYLRRRVVPDFIYDAARLFHLVLVGYSANDPPMRYLLNAVAADGTRFDDVRERFTLIGSPSPPDAIELEDWRARGITPIHYDSKDSHSVLTALLERWADLSSINGRQGLVEREIRRIVKVRRVAASVSDRDLFDHFVRRGNSSERARLAALASKCGADLGWLDAIASVISEGSRAT